MDQQTPPPGCPAHAGGQKTSVPLFGAEFTADPQRFYSHLRQFGPVAAVEMAPGVQATLVTSYDAALRVLKPPHNFVRDSDQWQAFHDGWVPQDSDALQLMLKRENALFADGTEHIRLRQAVKDSLDQVDMFTLGKKVEQFSDYLVDQFCRDGQVDLIAQFARKLPLLVFSDLFACTEDTGDRLISSISDLFDGHDAHNANATLVEALFELVKLRRRERGADVVSWLIEHESGLNDQEMVQQLVLLIGAGSEPLQNLIASTLWRLLHNPQLRVDEAVNSTLWNDPPIANYAVHYALSDTEVSGAVLPAGHPIVISFAAANTDPALSNAGAASGGAHLAWGAGPHTCPAKSWAHVIYMTGIERLLTRLPDMKLTLPAGKPQWRQGAFTRALVELPTQFPPESPTHTASATLPAAPRPAAPSLPSATDRPSAPAPEAAPSQPRSGGLWSNFRRWLNGQ
ncbi:cytochrome P450 [Streptomyces sp. 8L]|uniref:cytochrome P450 n=1 Tax=Streptomyces sp. 8L TaxID=2877242 RepID=UPI001CD1C48C|nr:cytochrome P450 [Streptomyces sp. 8L]MCA1217152.1 cytochrome P450 [Streptomyces sp. 8L]